MEMANVIKYGLILFWFIKGCVLIPLFVEITMNG